MLFKRQQRDAFPSSAALEIPHTHRPSKPWSPISSPLHRPAQGTTRSRRGPAAAAAKNQMPEQASCVHDDTAAAAAAARTTTTRQRSHGGMTGTPQQAGDHGGGGGFRDPGGYAEVDPTGRYGRYDEVLGKGSSKTVYRGFDEWQGIEVAWNQVRLRDFLRSPGELERLYGEVHLLSALRHSAVMRLHASWLDQRRRTLNFLTELFSSGTLRQYLERHRRVSMAAVRRWCRQILAGLAYLHGHHPPILHRDLKCDNIFVNGNKGEVKIGDLGLAAARASPPAPHCVGTPEFMAPEVYQEAYDELADVYSFGMCVLEMLTLEYPYSECTNPVQIYKRVISGIKPAALYKVTDPAVRRFIDRCLAPASRRPAARELLYDPFLQVGDGGFSSGDGNGGCNVMNSCMHLHQPSCMDHHAYSNGGSRASNGLLNSIHEDDTSIDRSYCEDENDDDDDDDDNRYHGIDRLFDEQEDDADGDNIAGADIKIKGRRMEDGNIFLRLRINDKDGTGLVRKIFFPFDTEADTALSVATEMVGELDITDHEVTHIAKMIDDEVSALVPDWQPGPGMYDGDDDSPDTPGTGCCHNCRSSSGAASSCGSLLDFMSSAAHRGCRCTELHGRFEEITFQPDEEKVHFQDGCSL